MASAVGAQEVAGLSNTLLFRAFLVMTFINFAICFCSGRHEQNYRLQDCGGHVAGLHHATSFNRLPQQGGTLGGLRTFHPLFGVVFMHILTLFFFFRRALQELLLPNSRTPRPGGRLLRALLVLPGNMWRLRNSRPLLLKLQLGRLEVRSCPCKF